MYTDPYDASIDPNDPVAIEAMNNVSQAVSRLFFYGIIMFYKITSFYISKSLLQFLLPSIFMEYNRDETE